MERHGGGHTWGQPYSELILTAQDSEPYALTLSEYHWWWLETGCTGQRGVAESKAWEQSLRSTLTVIIIQIFIVSRPIIKVGLTRLVDWF